MSRKLGWFGAAMLAWCLVAPAAASAAGRYIIEGTNGTLPANLAAVVAASGGTLDRVNSEIGYAQASATDPQFGAKLIATGTVAGVAEDKPVQWLPTPANIASTGIALTQSTVASPDPTTAFFFSCQWGLQQIHAPGAWSRHQFGGPNVEVAVLDTGTDPGHIDLAGKIDLANSAIAVFPGSSPCGAFDENTIFDLNHHGTFVSSMITGNGLGMAAVAPLSPVVAVKVLNCGGSGFFGDIIAGLQYAATLPNVKVINMSLGALVPRQGTEVLVRAMAKAIDFARDHGKVVISASGNDGVDLSAHPELIEVPGGMLGQIGVYATSNTEGLASYSNHGSPPTTWIGAPGGDFPNTQAALPGCVFPPAAQGLIVGACSSFVCPGNNFYIVGAGTSFSSPVVAGVAALFDAQNPHLAIPGVVEAVLALTATHLKPVDTFSLGVVDASRTVQLFGH